MKIAIHNSQRGFHPYWVEYCREENIPYKIVNCYSNNIIDQLSECDILMWHYHQADSRDILFAKQLLFSLEQTGKTVFPNFNSAWHFDDKVGQKYLLESISAPLVPSYVFYDKQKALNWIEKAIFPKVFKLRGGAGASNVSLIKTKREAKKQVKKAFGRGFSQYKPWSSLKERIRNFKIGNGSVPDIAKGIARFVYPPKYSKIKGKQRGYIYFQDFIPDNDSDIRIIVIGGKAFAVKRLARKNDFRASGSGLKEELTEETVDERCLRIAFEIMDELSAQCLSFDFVYDENNEPFIVEVSYGFSVDYYDNCPGFWDSQLNWHSGTIKPYSWMVDNVLSELNNRNV